jgi:hypothetical protein
MPLTTVHPKPGLSSLGAVRDDLIVLSLLAMQTPANAKKTYGNLVGPESDRYQFLVEQLSSQGLLSKAGRKFEVSQDGQAAIGRLWASENRPPKLKAPDLAKIVLIGSALGMDLNRCAQKSLQLASLPTAICLIAAKVEAPKRSVALQARATVTQSAATRAVIEQLVQDRVPGIQIKQSADTKPVTDPILVDLACGIAGLKDGCGAYEATVSVLERSVGRDLLTGSPQQSWWNLVSAIMALQPNSQLSSVYGSNDTFASQLSLAIAPSAARAPSGLVAISEAHRLFSLSHPNIGLSQFKDWVVAAAQQGKIELTPLSVASLLPSEIRRMSETMVGGRPFHFLSSRD